MRGKWSAYLVIGALASPSAALAATLPAGWTAAEAEQARAGKLQIHTLPASVGGTMEALFYVHATPAQAMAVLWDHARYAEFLPHAKSSKVLEQHGDTAVLEQIGGSGPITVGFVTRRHREAHRITWSLVRGDSVKRNDGYWEVQPATGGALVAYHVHAETKGMVPQRVASFLQRQALPDQCDAVKARIEAIAAHRIR